MKSQDLQDVSRKWTPKSILKSLRLMCPSPWAPLPARVRSLSTHSSTVYKLCSITITTIHLGAPIHVFCWWHSEGLLFRQIEFYGGRLDVTCIVWTSLTSSPIFFCQFSLKFRSATRKGLAPVSAQLFAPVYLLSPWYAFFILRWSFQSQ